MLFNSLDFAVFLPIVFILYWFVCGKNLKAQNVLLVVASYVFYGWWDWRFLFLILFSTLVDFAIGLALSKETNNKKRTLYLSASILVNIGLLGFFKYYNFFIDNFIDAFSFFGMQFEAGRLDVILPVGISFYTFQTLSYTIDIYRKKLEPTNHFIAFMAFVSFFPQLVAGPIERAKNMLPQFLKKRTFQSDQAIIGIKQIIWGLFKKIVIADNCAQYANEIFANYDSMSSATLVLGAVYFAFQVYGDFSGYSDIAIGTARLFNFKLMTNFRYPYFSRNIAEFWRRWHISLSTWFRDYVYISLGGNRGTKLRKVVNIIIVFVISGLWHGASWNFIFWGLLCSIFYLISEYFGNKKYTTSPEKVHLLPSVKAFLQMSLVFGSFAFGLIFFRLQDVSDAFLYLQRITEFSVHQGMLGIYRYPFEIFPLILVLLWWEWYNRHKEFPLFSSNPEFLRTALVLLFIVVFGNFEEMKQFFYFRF